MMKTILTAAALALAIGGIAPAKAQVTVDVAKISCDQFLMFQVADPQQIAIWISGYFHGKTGSTVLDVQALKANSEKVKDYCRGNLQMPVMQAVENVFGLKR